MRPRLERAFLHAQGAGLLALVPSAYMLEVYGRVLDTRSGATLAWLTAAALAGAAVMAAWEWLRGNCLRDAAATLESTLRPRLFDALLRAAAEGRASAGLQAAADARTLRDFVASPFVVAALELPVALAFLVLVFAANAWLGAVTLAGAVLQATLSAAAGRATAPLLAAANRDAQAAQRLAEGALDQADVVSAMGLQGALTGRWQALQARYLHDQAQASERALGLQAASRCVQQVMGSGLLGLAAFMLLSGVLPGGGGMVIVVSILGGRVLLPLAQLVANARAAVQARAAHARLRAFLRELPARAPTMPLPAPQGLLRVEQLSAGPPQRPGQPATAVLRGLDFTLRPGEVLAVIGPSASGKSSLARVLVGLWTPSAGAVRLDGAEIGRWDPARLGPHLGYVAQDAELLEGSIADNIARHGEGADPALLAAAVRESGLEPLLAAWPQGLQTQVGRRGSRLSGGQRQRIALARALYGAPTLVVLDEPDAHLDDAGDAALLVALRALKARGAVVVVMSHRTLLLPVVDRMLLLAGGRQQAFGSRDEVLEMLARAARGQAPGASPAVLPQLPVAAGARR
jgi:ATP-binding cassette subfamily C exporter for protease/lipase